jgi:ABC-2 type transport system ATP-binding protein
MEVTAHMTEAETPLAVTGPTALDVDDVSKTFGTVRAVRSASFTVSPGRVTGLLGANGSGKSTLMHCVVDVLRPDAGSILVNGHSATSRAAKAGLGFVPDELAVPKSLRGQEYLDFQCRLRRVTGDDLVERARWMAEVVGLGPALRRYIGDYSHGMRRRLQIVAALAHRPRLLVLDETFAGLDPEAWIVLEHLITRHREAGGAVLLSTHDMRLAERLCDDVLMMSEGAVIFSGETTGLGAGGDGDSLLEIFLTGSGLGDRVAGVLEALDEHLYGTSQQTEGRVRP